MTGFRRLAFAALLVAEILAQYAKIPLLKSALGPIAFAAWAMALGRADRTSRKISLVLVTVGSLLFLRSHASANLVVGSFAENTNVLMIMTLIPLIGAAVELGGYSEALAEASRKVTGPTSLYVLSTLLAFAIGSVLLNAAIALLWVVLFPVAQRASKDPTGFLVRSLPRGFNASLLWTPASPSIAVALSVTGAAWGAIAGPGFAMSVAVLAIAIAIEWRGLAAEENAHIERDAEPGARARLDPVTIRKLIALAAGLVSLIASIIIVESFGATIYQAVLPCVFGTLLVWLTLLRKVAEGTRSLAKRLDEAMSGMSSQFLLMTTAGFIGTAVKTAAAKGLPGFLGTIAGNPAWFALAVSSLVLLLSILGIHPQIGIVITYSLVARLARNYPAGYVCLALLLGAALGFSVSPVSATMLVTSSCAGTNTIEVGLKRHWKYVLLVLPVGVLLLRALFRV
jgi:hypothetical protein